MSEPNFNQAREYIFRRLSTELAHNLFYHGIHHTRDYVLPATEEFASFQSIQGESKVLLLTGALYHDIGYIERYSRNEPIAVKIAQDTLPTFGYTPSQIQVVGGIIMATQLPQLPKDILEELMCDADLTSLGKTDFFDISDSLRREFIEYGVTQRSMTDKEWYEFQLNFLQTHSYFTEAARTLRGETKQRNIAELKRRLGLI